MPATFSFPRGVEFLATDVSDVFRRYKVLAVGIREADYSRFAPDASARDRIRIEGALVAACVRNGQEPKFLVWKSIASALEAGKAVSKKDFMSAENVRAIDWRAFPVETKDAVVACLSVMS